LGYSLYFFIDWVKMKNNVILEIRGVSKVFGSTVALDGIDFELRKGEVHAIVGENGAGKSTLMKILSGAYTKDRGTILFDRQSVDIDSVEVARNIGVSMIYQELEDVPTVTVAENIFLGRLPRGKIPGFLNFRELFDDTKKILHEYNVDINPQRKISTLTTGERQFIEIIRAVVVKNAKIVIMDEPTSSLTKSEVEKLFSIVGELRKKGISVIYISHRLDEVMGIADRVSVFRDGKNRGTLEKHELDPDKVVSLMIGHVLKRVEKKSSERKKVVFEVKKLSVRNRVVDFSMKIYEGEILGIAGLMGSGKDELVESIFGLWPAQYKETYFFGEKILIKSPVDALRYGIVYLPEERKSKALFLEMSVNDNVVPLWLFYVKKSLFPKRKREVDVTEYYVKRLSIKTPSVFAKVADLSGGNQQKTILSRLMAVKPKMLVLNDPTRGIDVGSKEEIYSVISALSDEGIPILILSSEIPEICKLANRVIVLSKGRICAEFVDNDVTTKNVIRATMGI